MPGAPTPRARRSAGATACVPWCASCATRGSVIGYAARRDDRAQLGGHVGLAAQPAAGRGGRPVRDRFGRSEECRVGKEGVSPCMYRGAMYVYKKIHYRTYDVIIREIHI